MIKLPYYVVDSFSSVPLAGNPAGVCPLDKWLPDGVMQRIAAENNVSETAFFVPNEGGFHIRWFSPTVEINLCGHATLASAYVLYECRKFTGPSVRFDSKSGPLVVERAGERLVMDFPMLELTSSSIAPDLVEGLGALPGDAFSSMDQIAVFDSEAAVLHLKPDLGALKRLDGRGVIATAPGRDCDYVLRFFGPKVGIDEDPVTGSAQSQIAPYWAKKLGKKKLTVKQLSSRGGELYCEIAGDRVKIGGAAALYLKGEITI